MTDKKFSKTDDLARPHAKPNTRADGELYERPRPNVFSSLWLEGYQDAMDNWTSKVPDLKLGERIEDYHDGYSTGRVDREHLDRMGSSNA